MADMLTSPQGRSHHLNQNEWQVKYESHAKESLSTQLRCEICSLFMYIGKERKTKQNYKSQPWLGRRWRDVFELH